MRFNIHLDDDHLHMRHDVTLHLGSEMSAVLHQLFGRLDRIEAALSVVQQQGVKMDQDISDLQQAITDIGTAVDQLPGMVDAFEARITDIIKNSTGMPAEDRAALKQATVDLRSKATKIAEAIADATDGIDEAANTGGDGGGDEGDTGGEAGKSNI